jgi:hypothetical protein
MVCLSTAEAEFVAATHACKDVVWLRNVLRDLSFPQSSPTIIYEDNQACVAMIRNHSVSGRNRHFCIKMVWLREQVANNVVSFRYVPSKHNVADIFTKVMPAVAFQTLRDMLLEPRLRHGYDLAISTSKDVLPRGGCRSI